MISNLYPNNASEHEEIIHSFYQKCKECDNKTLEYYSDISEIQNQTFTSITIYALRGLFFKNNDAKNQKEKKNKSEIIIPKEKYKYIFISDPKPIMNVPKSYADFEKELRDNNSKDFNSNNENLNDFFLDNFDNELLYEEPKMKNLPKAEQKLILENKVKDFYNDIVEVMNFSNNDKSIKSSQKTKNYSYFGSKNKKIGLGVKSLPKFPIVKKENYIKVSSNEDRKGKPNQHKKTNPENKENKKNNQNFEGEQNSKDNIKNKEANNSFNNFELDAMNLELDKDSNELFDIKNYSFYKSENYFSGNCPKKRDKEDGNSEEKMEDNSYDYCNIVNSQISNKTYSMLYNSYLNDSSNISKTFIFPSNSLLSPSSAFSSTENFENFALFDLNSKIERTDDDNKSLEHLFNKKRKREIFDISKIPKPNKKLNNNNNNNNSCIIGNINQKFIILPNKNNNKSMINYINKNNKKKSNKKTLQNIFSTKIKINEKNMLDNSQEKNTITANNLSDIDNDDDSFIKKKRDKVVEKIKEKIIIKRPYELERTLCRKFRDYLSDNKTLFEDIINQDKNFWDHFYQQKI